MSPRAVRQDSGKAAPKQSPLESRWPRLHAGDCEPFPDAASVAELAGNLESLQRWVTRHGGASAVAQRLQQAWLAFHDGQFREAIDAGRALGTLGAAVAGKAAAVHSLSQASDDSRVIKLLEEAAARGESAVAELPGYANAHYTLALVLGRYSQRISIVHALAEGLASRVRTHLDRTLEVEPRHAEAHIALGLYHAEIVAQLGSLAARFTYGATAEAALGHFREALALTPHSPIALMEYAHGLLRLDAGKHRTQARTLLQRAARCSPLDAMERLDRDRAHEELARL